jgi:hypothetical protein
MPSGVVYVSDMQSGLFVLKPKATSVRYGVATAGTVGAAPTIHTYGASYLGNPRFRIDAEKLQPNQPGAFFLGAGRGNTPIFGINLYVALSPAPIAVNVAANNHGVATVPMGLPNLAALAGAVLDAQFVFIASATPGDFSATQGIEFELFQL